VDQVDRIRRQPRGIGNGQGGKNEGDEHFDLFENI
jgi:hypothetical protein